MTRLKQAWLALCVVTLCGCGFKGEIDVANAPDQMECVDTRDGERFSFRPADVYDVSVGVMGADTCAKVTDLAGVARVLCNSHQVFLKCEPKRAKGKVRNG